MCKDRDYKKESEYNNSNKPKLKLPVSDVNIMMNMELRKRENRYQEDLRILRIPQHRFKVGRIQLF